MQESTEKQAASENTSESVVPIPKKQDSDVEENKVVAALSYIGPLFFIPLFLKRESPFCQFHAKQGLAFFVLWIIGWVVFWFPIFGQLAMLILAIVNIYAFVKAIQGEKWVAPVVGDLAKKINI